MTDGKASTVTDREIEMIVDGVLLLLSWQKFMRELKEQRRVARIRQKETAAA